MTQKTISDERLVELRVAISNKYFDFLWKVDGSVILPEEYGQDFWRDIKSAVIELQNVRECQGSFDPQAFWDSIPTEDSPVWPVACVDVNGVLDVYTGWSGKVEMFPLAEGAREFLVRLREHFNTIILLTATMPVKMVEQWVEENGLSDLIDGVTNHKVPADVYLDDRAVTFIGNYDLALEEMINFTPHWKVVEE